jgi:hypothetical protein
MLKTIRRLLVPAKSVPRDPRRVKIALLRVMAAECYRLADAHAGWPAANMRQLGRDIEKEADRLAEQAAS